MAVFPRIGSENLRSGADQFAVFDPHAGFDTQSFGLNRGSQNTTGGGSIGSDSNRFTPQQRVGLLLDGGKTGIKIDVHNS